MDKYDAQRTIMQLEKEIAIYKTLNLGLVSIVQRMGIDRIIIDLKDRVKNIRTNLERPED